MVFLSECRPVALCALWLKKNEEQARAYFEVPFPILRSLFSIHLTVAFNSRDLNH
jgi:hypothetical protein